MTEKNLEALWKGAYAADPSLGSEEAWAKADSSATYRPPTDTSRRRPTTRRRLPQATFSLTPEGAAALDLPSSKLSGPISEMATLGGDQASFESHPGGVGPAVEVGEAAPNISFEDTVAGTPSVEDSLRAVAVLTQRVGAVTARPVAPGGLSGGESYALSSEIGRGGMGVVYRAVQGSLEREVAIKTLLPEKSSEAARESFVSEALVTGALDHPNVVPVHELGCNQDGEVFLAMKLVAGHAWRDLLHPHTQQERKAAADWDQQRHFDVLLQVCNAVSFAHSRGLVHRDLKPENIMVGNYGETMVMDWGVAVDVRDDVPWPPRAPHKTQVFGPAGTPIYMAPEQALGDNAVLGPRTDVFLLGAILHEILTGRAPHSGDTLVEVLQCAARCERQVYDDRVPSALQAICHKAMAPRPDDRYPSVQAFQGALRQYIAHARSMTLADEADAIAAALEKGEMPAWERYGEYARALARYEQALAVWVDNPQALQGQARTALRCAEEALDRHDGGLAEAQIALLQLNPAVDPERLAVVQARLKRQNAGRARSVVALLLMVGLAAAAWLGIRSVTDQDDGERAHAAALAAYDRKAQEAWQAVSARDLLAVQRAETRLAEDDIAAAPSSRERSKTLRGAKKLMLWQEGRHRALFAMQCGDILDDLRRAHPDRLSSLWDHPAIAGTPVAALLQRAWSGAGRGFCAVMADELAGGTPVATVLAAFETLALVAEDKLGKPERPEPSGRSRLLEAAICAIGTEARRALTDEAGQHACAAKTLPFSMAEAPFGPMRRTPATPPPLMRRGPRGEWVAEDPRTRVELWRTLPPGEGTASQVVVPVEDGSVIIGSGPTLKRYDGLTGRVLGRVALPSEPLIAWPDPLTRRRIQVISWASREQGRVDVSAFYRGRALMPVHMADTVQQWSGTARPVLALAERVRRDTAASLGLTGAAAHDDPRIGAAIFERLLAEAAVDPFEPDLPAHALLVGGAAVRADRRDRAADLAVRASAGLLPLHIARIGVTLERAGFARRAEELYDHAAREFIRRGGNADLNVHRIGSPASIIRKLGADRFAAGDVDRALELLDIGRRFSTVLEGDATFYRRYLRWQTASGRPGLEEVARQQVEAARAGNMLVATPLDLLLIDVAGAILLLVPPLLLLLLLRLWWVSRASVKAALWAVGLQTRGARWGAFVTDPWLRLRQTFWSYATRPQRLMVFVAASVLVVAACVLASNTERVSLAPNTPLHLGNGQPGHTAFVLDVQAALRAWPEDPALLRLQAEGLRSLGRAKVARQAIDKLLAVAPADAVGRNNLGVLLEEGGDAAGARAAYEAAAGGTDSGAAAARANLARLSGAAAALETLSNGDRRRAAAIGAKAALWAGCSLGDLRRLVIPRHGVGERSVGAFGQMLRGKLASYGVSTQGPAAARFGLFVQSWLAPAGLLFLACALLAMVWLPLSSLPHVAERPRKVPTAGPEGGLARAAAQVRGAGEALGLSLGILVPGLRWLVSGPRAAGAAVLLAFLLLVSVWFAAGAGGVLGSFFQMDFFDGYFPGVVEPGLHFAFRDLGRIAGGLALTLVSANAALQARSLWIKPGATSAAA